MTGNSHRTRWSYRFAFSALVAGVMSLLIGGAIAWLQTGGRDALSAWLETAPLAFAVAFPTSLLVVPLVQSVLDGFFANNTGENG